MNTEIKVPVLPESIADATVANWYKNIGDTISADEVLVDLETDKVILEVPAVKAGVIKEILFAVGDTVTSGQLLAVVDETASGASSEKSAVEGTASKNSRVAAMSPSVRKLIAEHDIDETQLTGSGKSGRILKQDVEDYLASGDVGDEGSHSPSLSKENSTQPLEKIFHASGSSERLERRVPMTRLRARIAERLVQSQQEAAILTTFNEVNMKPVMELRSRYKDAFEKKFGVRLGFMSFFVQASVEALKRFPEINASIDGTDVVYHGYYDIGVAVSGPNGLVVPILRNADIQTISEIEQSIIHYGTKAKENSLTIEDITGGTFTISNGGVFGSMLSTPILNPPQSAILGMHNISERAMVVDGEIKALPIMYLALSYDHRLVDGKSAVQFLVTIKDLLEDPSRMLLGV
jgi:2-oxoglutarate dehydrogenase E2 component (dihydrolipoamide succinyltransferase)